jgi:hypothetical protein
MKQAKRLANEHQSGSWWCGIIRGTRSIGRSWQQIVDWIEAATRARLGDVTLDLGEDRSRFAVTIQAKNGDNKKGWF